MVKNGKINLKSFQIHIFTFQNILNIFLLKKNYLVADRGLTPLPLFTDMSVTIMFFLCLPLSTQLNAAIKYALKESSSYLYYVIFISTLV